jgi:hypothetical protein
MRDFLYQEHKNNIFLGDFSLMLILRILQMLTYSMSFYK